MRPLRVSIILLLLVIAAFLFFGGISKSALWEEDEVWYAQVAREMAVNNDFVTLTFGGEPFFHKPPLFYWLMAFSGKIFGFSEFSARAVSAVAGVATVVLAFFLGEMLFGLMAGVFSALILATSFQFVIQAKLAYIDPILTLFITATFFFFWRGQKNNRTGDYVLAYLTAGLATLTKGPIGFILPYAAFCGFLLFQNRRDQIRQVLVNWGLLVFGVVVLPWYCLETTRFGFGFLQEHFGYHMVARFAQGIETHAEPWYYYLLVLAVGYLPWIAFFPAVCAQVFKNLRHKEIGFTVLWAAIVLVFFSISRSKLPGYILPAFVPLSLLTGKTLSAFIKKDLTVPAWAMRISFFILFGFLVLLAALLWFVIYAKAPAGFSVEAQGLVPMAYLLAGGAIASSAAFVVFPRKMYWFFVVVAWVIIINVFFMHTVVPMVETFRPMKSCGMEIAARVGVGDKVASYPYLSRDLFYYSGQPVVALNSLSELNRFLSQTNRVFVALYISDWEKIKPQITAPARLIFRKNHGLVLSNQ